MSIPQEISDYVVRMRRYFHEYPELSWQEEHTSQRIQEELSAMDIPFVRGRGTSIIATIQGALPGKMLGIRADIDALPVTEKTGLPFASAHQGISHACGHDAHISILLAAARMLNAEKDQLKGTVRLIFQPAEEFIQDSGAKYLAQDPLVREVDAIIGLHIWGDIDVGKAALQEGPIMASADTFDIYIQGKNGHGASPHTAIDPITAGSEVVQSLQLLVSRENDPLEPMVLSITAFNSGNSKNVIPDTAHLEGTTRSFNNALRDRFEGTMKRVLDGIATSTRTHIQLDYHDGTPATVNHKEAVALGQHVAHEVFHDGLITNFPRVMGGEDFAKYLVEIPGCFMLLGCAGEGGHFAQHDEHFNLDERALPLGVEYFVSYARAYLGTSE